MTNSLCEFGQLFLVFNDAHSQVTIGMPGVSAAILALENFMKGLLHVNFSQIICLLE